MFESSQLIDLVSRRDRPCVSLYMPTHRTGREMRQDPIRLSNLLKSAEHQLAERSVNRATTTAVLEPARRKIEDLEFWMGQQDGLACFLSPRRRDFVSVGETFDEQLHVGDRHAVRPLLPVVQRQQRFFLLALSQHGCQLFEGDEERLASRELPCEDLAVEELVPDRRIDGALQYRSSQSPQAQRMGDSPVYHGQTPLADNEEADLQRFLRAVETCVTDSLKGERAPLILAAVDFLTPAYAALNRYPSLAPASVPGNPQRWSRDDLHRQALGIAHSLSQRQIDKTIAAVANELGGPLQAVEVGEVIPAAMQGAVDTLLVDHTACCRGSIDPATQRVEFSQNGRGEDLLEVAVAETIVHGGAALAVDKQRIPGGKDIVAKLRYPRGEP